MIKVVNPELPENDYRDSCDALTKSSVEIVVLCVGYRCSVTWSFTASSVHILYLPAELGLHAGL